MDCSVTVGSPHGCTKHYQELDLEMLEGVSMPLSKLECPILFSSENNLATYVVGT